MTIKELAKEISDEFESQYGVTNAVMTKRVLRMCKEISEAVDYIEARKKYYAADTTPQEAEVIDQTILNPKRSPGRPRGKN